MIPYSEMTFSDFDFYWGQSTLFHIIKGKWEPVSPFTRDEDDGDLVYCGDDSLESLHDNGYEITYTRYTGGGFMAKPLDPFLSSDWVTYEPRLGYFLLNDRLMLLTSNTPRSRHKGLHSRRLRTMTVVDGGGVSKAVATMLRPIDVSFIPYVQLAQEIARRLNELFSSSWYLSIVDSLVAANSIPVVLNHTTAFVPEEGTDYGYLLLNGAMLGRVQMQGTRLVFLPRCKPTSKLEESVSAVVRASLVTVPRTVTLDT